MMISRNSFHTHPDQKSNCISDISAQSILHYTHVKHTTHFTQSDTLFAAYFGQESLTFTVVNCSKIHTYQSKYQPIFTSFHLLYLVLQNTTKMLLHNCINTQYKIQCCSTPTFTTACLMKFYCKLQYLYMWYSVITKSKILSQKYNATPTRYLLTQQKHIAKKNLHLVSIYPHCYLRERTERDVFCGYTNYTQQRLWIIDYFGFWFCINEILTSFCVPYCKRH